MSSVAARSFGVSASGMRPTSPYLKAPPLAHSTTSPMACFLVVATRRAAVRKSLRSWLNPELAADPLPMLGAGEGGLPQARGLADASPPETLVPFPTRAGLGKHTHHAGETNSLAHGVSTVTLAVVAFSVPTQIRLRIRTRPSNERHCGFAVRSHFRPTISYHFSGSPAAQICRY
jgi:hypothetical protein